MTAQTTLAEFSESIAQMTEVAGRSVVALCSTRAHATSGVLWQKGLVVTSNHAAPEDELTVLFAPGTSVIAQAKGRDPSTDLAIFSLDRGSGAPAVAGDAERLRVGDFVLALGRTRRGNLTASSGIISGIMGAWDTWSGGHIDRFIRPDLTLYRGYSGGPLLNAKGEVVGLNTSALRRGTPVTIPTSTVTRVVAELLAKGYVARPHLGVALQPVSLPATLLAKLNLETRYGLLLVDVEENGSASRAGLMLGDILIEVEGKPVGHFPRLRGLLSNQKVGEPVTVAIIRSGEKRNVSITLGERPRR